MFILSPAEAQQFPEARFIDARIGADARERYLQEHIKGAIAISLPLSKTQLMGVAIPCQLPVIFQHCSANAAYLLIQRYLFMMIRQGLMLHHASGGCCGRWVIKKYM